MKSFRKLLSEVYHTNVLKEDGEAPTASTGQMTSDGSGIAGLGDDARAGNVIVRKKPRMFKRRKQR